MLAREGVVAPTLTVLRSASRHAFDEDERRVAAFVLPHLMRGWVLMRLLDVIHAGSSALDGLPTGVVFLSASGVIISANREAERILGCDDGLSCIAGAITATDPAANSLLRKTIQAALAPIEGAAPLAVSVPRPSLQRDYQVSAAPVRGSLRQFEGMSQPLAVLFIADPERSPAFGSDLLSRIYSLTTREADLAARLARGLSLEQAAEELCITYETARTHLRRIFSKTGTSRQAELILLMARLPAPPSEATLDG